MANITAQQVNDLRARTGAGLMDCKKALVEANGDAEAAAEILRKKGSATRDKKAGRAANEGTIQCFIDSSRQRGAIVEVNCESDFVAKNELFQTFALSIARQITTTGNDENVADQALADGSGKKVNDLLTEQVTKTGENLILARTKFITAKDNGVLFSYIHNGGKIGVIVELRADKRDIETFQNLGKQVAMHIAAANPRYLDRSEIPADVTDKEREIAAAQAAGKPPAAIAKIVEGKLEKFYGDNCLVDQPFVLDQSKKVHEAATSAASATVAAFIRFQIGQ